MPFLPRLSNLLPTFPMMLLVILGMNPGIAVAQLRCYDCHGTRSTGDYRPLDASTRDINTGGFAGNHRTHMAPGATAASCNPCHYAPDAVPAFYSSHHRDRRIQVAENINNSPHPDKAGYYRNGEKAVFFNQTAVPLPGSCVNVNCHFETVTPEWGDAPLTRYACTACHGAPPGYGAHAKHCALLGTGTISCSRCHTDHPSEADPLAHARQAGSRSLYIQFSGAANSGGSYNAGNETEYPNYLPSQHPTRNGVCTTLYCHSNGKGSLVASPPWSSGLTLGCNGCHGTGTTTGAPDYANGGEGAALANSHPRHMDSGRIICADCHIGTTVTGTSIVAGSTLHINQQLDVTFTDGGSYDKQPKSCSDTLCHFPAVPVWGGTLPADCSGCHGGNAVSTSDITTGKHTAHMNNHSTLGRGNNLGCAECHASTVDSDRHISNQLNHLNNIKNYSGARAGRIVTTGRGRCTNSYCHSSGTRENQHWNMSSSRWESGTSLNCSGCHGTLTLPDGTFQAYTSVAGEPSYPNTGIGTPLANSHQKHVVGSQDDTTGCSRCHRSTGDAAIAGKLRDYSTAHLDRQRNVRFAAAIQGRYSATSQQCLNLYCHSNGEPFDNSTAIYLTATWGDSNSTSCGSCHGDTASADTLSGRHGKHTTSTIYESSCDRCHANTINADGSLKDKKLHANRNKDIAFREGGTYNTATKGCGGTTYCHSASASVTPPWDAPVTAVKWSDKTNSMQCYSCHNGRLSDETEQACNAINGAWSSAKLKCTPSVTMTSNGHLRLASPQWIRKYPCSYCHNATLDASGAIADKTRHMNSTKDVEFSQQWAITGRLAPSYDKATKTCENIYCHSDGTTDPEEVRPFPWTRGKTHCNTCHGHPLGGCDNTSCHDGETHADDGIFWPIKTGWPVGEEWKAAVPMFRNEGPASARANSHPRHAETDFTCDNCHAVTIKQSNGSTSCYGSGCHVDHEPIPSGSMSEAPHLNAGYHVNKIKDVVFKDGGDYNENKSCTNTKCHTGRNLKNDPTFKLSLTDPVWGGTSSSLVCVSCHGTTTADVDSFGPTNSTRARINTTEWVTAGHGRMSSATNSRYSGSGNPAANFPINPCWYCHDNRVLHNSAAENPFRLRLHKQFQNRFSKECVYCHMEGKDSECLECHNAIDNESLAPQLSAIFYSMTARWPDGTIVERQNHAGYTTCTSLSCHYVDFSNPKNDLKIHNQGAGFWSRYQKEDVKNQYVMMGVCLKCHDDDSGGKCTACHPGNQAKYGLGFDPGTGFIKPKVARATSAHFGYKHYRALMSSGVDYGQGMTGWNNYTGHSVGTWKGGKFCWDCHDPHGDSNIYMIQGMVATSTDGRFGIPMTREKVVFTRKMNGNDYTTFDTTTNKYTGICNVCHSSSSKHYTSTSADSHNASKVCTTCHEHRFTDSHADGLVCNGCHKNKPVPRHSGFGLPRDCTKCHTGALGKRMDIMGQFGGPSHHVQGVEVTNKHCYACHWEATKEGVIDNKYHEGYNYKTYTSVKNAKSDLVVWQPGRRPTWYNTTTAVQFLANKVSFGILSTSRKEVGKLNNHCIGCHNDQNNDSTPFDDCKTPRQYAWDYKSIDARYNPQGDKTTLWGKYSTNGKRTVTKAFSAHGNAKGNQGGWSSATGVDGNIPNLRDNSQNVQCYDCHSSHGSKLAGVTSSYVTFNGARNGGNLKETVAGSGGYNMTYKAAANSSGINPYSAGAGQCFDCHLTQNSGATPWGYSTFGLSAPVKGYMDSDRFGEGATGSTQRFPFKTKAMKGGHFKSSSYLNRSTAAQNRINGLCTPCHDPHGVTPTLGSTQAYAVPLLKGTWMTSPYKEDTAPTSTANPPTVTEPLESFRGAEEYIRTDKNTFPPIITCGYDDYGNPTWCSESPGHVSEDASKFAGLCLRCHSQQKLTNGVTHTWKSVDRVHESVKGWKTTNGNVQHYFTCSKCHTPHATNLPRLMVTNCLDYNHRGGVASGGSAGRAWGLFPYTSGPRWQTEYLEWGGAFPKGGKELGKNEVPSNCHPAGAWPDNSWNSVTPW